MKILLLGSGGREHALAWKIAQSDKCDKLYIAPGNAGTSNCGENIAMKADDFEAIKTFCVEKDINMVVVGPEDPLVKGIYDNLKEDARTKDSEGSYAQEQMTSKGWSVQVDSLEATAAALKAIITMFNSDTPVTVGWDQTETTAGTQNRTAANAAFARSGNAILSDFSIQANNRQNMSVSRQFTGTGGLS